MGHVQKRGSRRYRVRYRAPNGVELSGTFRRNSDAETFLTTTEAAKVRGD